MGTRKLGRTTDHRLAMLKSLTTSLLLNGKIETTEAKAKEVRSIVEKLITLGIKEQSNKNIWCYTGWLFEELLENPRQRELLSYIDVIVDGRFIDSLKDETLRFRGSSNQRIIDVQASLQKGETVIMDI